MAPLAAPAAGDTYEWSVTSTLCLVVLLGICGGLQFGCACFSFPPPPPCPGLDPVTRSSHFQPHALCGTINPVPVARRRSSAEPAQPRASSFGHWHSILGRDASRQTSHPCSMSKSLCCGASSPGRVCRMTLALGSGIDHLSDNK